ncbi:MAG: transketolase, partial [bacterium]|nr:transketolase [bacterium]
MYSLEELQQKAHQVRKDVVDICCNNGAGHIAPSLSCIDILVSLY